MLLIKSFSDDASNKERIPIPASMKEKKNQKQSVETFLAKNNKLQKTLSA